MLKHHSLLNGTSLPPAQVSGLGLDLVPIQVTGIDLAYLLRGKTADQRAIFAAAWGFVGSPCDPTCVLIKPTDKQRTSLFGVSLYQLHHARELDPDQCWRVFHGWRRLSDKAERLEKVVRAAGPDATWDALVSNLG